MQVPWGNDKGYSINHKNEFGLYMIDMEPTNIIYRHIFREIFCRGLFSFFLEQNVDCIKNVLIINDSNSTI